MKYIWLDVRTAGEKFKLARVKDADICLTKCLDKICTIFCPAEVYKWEESRMHVGYEGCHECGSCRIGCPHQNIKWEYPKGGHGIVFRLG
jgi:ferredoxin like protein